MTTVKQATRSWYRPKATVKVQRRSEHELNTVPSFRRDGWEDRCSCGWRSNPQRSMGAAEVEGTEHLLHVGER